MKVKEIINILREDVKYIRVYEVDTSLFNSTTTSNVLNVIGNREVLNIGIYNTDTLNIIINKHQE